MSLINIDIDLLRTLIVVVERQSFTAAGEQLFRSQSAISLQMKRLEETLGKKVLDRGSGQGMALTSYGRLVYQYAREILELNDAMVREIAHQKEPKILRLGVPDDYAELILPGIVERLSRMEGHLEIQIIADLSTTLDVMIDNGELDMAIMTQDKGLDGLGLCEERLTWVGRDREVIRHGDPLNLALFPDGCGVRSNALKALRKSSFKWHIGFSSKSFSILKATMLAQGAIGVLPTRAVPPDLVPLGREEGLPALDDSRLIMRFNHGSSYDLHPLFSKIARNVGAATLPSAPIRDSV
jgi:DNA-binding transcriptional LysR family regulator